MNNLVLRFYAPGDTPALAQLKSEYVRALYRGFVPSEVLKKATPDYYAEQLARWFDSHLYHIALSERAGKISSFVVYGADPEQSSYGLIYELACDHIADAAEKRAVVDFSLAQMRQEGYAAVHLWVLRDNFRVRFLFESLGFRHDGSTRTLTISGQELLIARYTFPLT